jgi:hypothetical protein
MPGSLLVGAAQRPILEPTISLDRLKDKGCFRTGSVAPESDTKLSDRNYLRTRGTPVDMTSLDSVMPPELAL